MLDLDKRDYQLGIVKWFGGYNHQKGRENDFGFIQSMVGEDVFVHANEIKSGGDLNEDEVIIYELGERNGKSFARNVHRPLHEPKIIESVVKLYLKKNEQYSDFFSSYTFDSSFKNLLNNDFIKISDEEGFLEFLNIVYDDNAGFLFSKIDNYLSIKGELGRDVFQLLLDNLEIIGYKNILQSPNNQTYLADVDIRAFISENISESSENLSNSELDELIDNGLIGYGDVYSNHSFIDYAYNDLDKHKELFELLKDQSERDGPTFNTIKQTRNWCEIFKIIVGRKSLKTLLNNGLPIDCIPSNYLSEKENELFEFVKSLDENDTFFNVNIESLPKNIVLASIIEGLLTNQDLIITRYDEIKNIIENRYRNVEKDIPQYLISSIDTLFENLNDYFSNPSIRLIFEPMLFKKSLYEKSPKTKHIFDKSANLSNSIEYFILANLFSLIQANNILDNLYDVLLYRIWEALLNEQIDINDYGIFKLFPSCGTLYSVTTGEELSCESFYWKTVEDEDDIFLCRNTRCQNPQIIPDTNKHYLDYNIYDWFEHYEIRYLIEQHPSKRDFPIKLAGYFNRLKELFDIIKCRECYNIMMPDMRYARVEYYEFDPVNNEIVKRNLSAEYRVTVFKCILDSCPEKGNTYYINHCLGFGCGSMIDTRDLKLKCDNGLYICRNCGSCCEQCFKNNPNGFCPDCGSNLILYEKYNSRFVYCSKRDCDFKISEKDLPKKFLLPSAPVKKVGDNSNYSNSYQNYNRSSYVEEDLPF